MSLINDALKRAKAAQEQAPPEAPHGGPQFRPVDADQVVRHGVGLMVPISLATIALLILLLVWLARQHIRQGESMPVRAAETQKAPAVSAVDSSSLQYNDGQSTGGTSKSVQATTPAGSATPVTTLAKTASNASVTSTQGALPNATAPLKQPAETTSEPSVGSTTATNGTNSVTAALQPAKPALPKLQGIVFNPRRPSAVINGKTLFVGDRVAGFRVMAIGRDTATLVSAGQTNILTLEE